ncbi:restriction endonuclease subunit S [Micromonospora sp. MH33]|uniref:restriction endonuclease subunit S n=1 Tax=Micromonospora sp. MH33 TaxID=1945509 RepID=UPI0011B266A8|nr:restriction endonuclease subunit S [Micromonospora sp. MH33]
MESRFRYEAVISGGQVDPRAEPWSGMVLVAPNHIESGTGRLVGRETAADQGADSGKYVATAGQILYSKIRPALNKVAIAVEDCLCSADMYAISLSDRLDTRFARYFMSAKPFHDFATAMSMRVKMPKVNREELADGPWLLPKLSEQRAIADYLDRETARIDTLIKEQQRLIEMLRERRDGVVTKTFLNSASEERSLKFAVDDVTVGIVVQPSRWYVDAGVPALRGVNVKRGSISFSDLIHISEEGHAAHPKSQLRSGDIVIVRTGRAGAAAKVPDALDGANAIDILIVRPGEGTNPDFLVWYLNSPLAASRIEHGSVGALQGHFNVSALRELPLPDASLVEQQRIVAYLDEQIAKIDTMITETERFIELARERRSALITAAVTGQIDVRETA